jgi:photosystem II stability/assembly factor-like uncharacterized protein
MRYLLLSPVFVSGLMTQDTSEGLPSADVQDMTLDPVTPTTLYVNVRDEGVFKSTDGAISWTATSWEGLPSTVYHLSIEYLMAIDPSNSNTLYVGTGAGVYKSADGGSTWSAASSGLPAGPVEIADIAIDPLNPSTVYASVTNESSAWVAAVYKSMDGGANWISSSSGLQDWWIRLLVIDPLTITTLYAGTISTGLYKSTDGGSNWSPITAGVAGEIYDFVIDPKTPTTVYLSTPITVNRSEGVYKSIDGGANWTGMANGLANELTNPGPNVYSFAIDPSSPATLYAGTSEGVYKYETVSGGGSTQVSSDGGGGGG